MNSQHLPPAGVCGSSVPRTAVLLVFERDYCCKASRATITMMMLMISLYSAPQCCLYSIPARDLFTVDGTRINIWHEISQFMVKE